MGFYNSVIKLKTNFLAQLSNRKKRFQIVKITTKGNL